MIGLKLKLYFEERTDINTDKIVSFLISLRKKKQEEKVEQKVKVPPLLTLFDFCSLVSKSDP